MSNYPGFLWLVLAAAVVVFIVICTRKKEWLESAKLKLEVFALLAGVAVGAAGAFWGYQAWRENRDANKLNVANQLYAQDEKISETIAQEPLLEALWAEFPDETNAVARARQLVLLVTCTNDVQHTQWNKSNADVISWKTIPDLVNGTIYNAKGFHDERRARLRKAFNFAEKILYEVDNAFGSYKRGFLEEEDFQTWVAYVQALGTHPLFLGALQYAHDYGFIAPASCVFFKERITNLKGARDLLEQIYPEILADTWATTNGPYRVGCSIEVDKGK